MSDDSARQFIEAVRHSGLVSEADLATVTQQCNVDSTLPPPEIAAKFVEQKSLTSFQAAQILAGRGGECVLGSRYRILEQLGAGAMGTVYKAIDSKLDRAVAIKILPQQSVSDPDAVARFNREAKALAKLAHPNIVQAYDSGEDRGRHFLIMECVDGVSLAQLVVERGRITPTLAADYAYQAAIGLQHAHEKGLVHRDLKPSNLFLTRDRQVKILDLGLARFLQDQVGDSTLTREGAGMGTPDYMAPEQFHDARHVDARSDIYSLGCTLYHMIAGQVPFPGSSISEKYTAHETRDPAPLEQACPEIPAGLAIAVSRMMAKRPADRFQSAREVAEALAPYIAGASHAILQIRATASWHGSQLGFSVEPIRVQRRRKFLVGTAAITVTALVLAFVFWAGGALRPTSDPNIATHRSDLKNQQQVPFDASDDPMVLTVAQGSGGQFTTISAALENAKPGMTIRVLDDAIYREAISLSRPSAHTRLTLESPRGTTIESDSSAAIIIQDVPQVRVSGFRINTKGPAAVAILGQVPGATLDGLMLEGSLVFAATTSQQAAQSLYGVAIEGADISDDQLPVVIQNCTVRRFAYGIRVSAIGNDYSTPLPGRRILICNNAIEDCSTGTLLLGKVEQIQVVGNRISGSALTAVQLERLLDGAKDILVANNTMFESKYAFRVWDETIRGKNVQISNNLTVGRPGNPDMVFIDSGGDRQNPRGAGEGRRIHDAWEWSHNWREVRTPTRDDPVSKSWIPQGKADVMSDKIALLSTDRASTDFLRPADSELASGGVGVTDPSLPAYIGAVPPAGATPWDWRKTWQERHPQMLLTVSKEADKGGEFRTINEAIARVTRPNMTIRVLDDATYDEAIQIINRTDHEGLTLESPQHATLSSVGGRSVVYIFNVPRVTLRGFRIQTQPQSQFCVIVGGLCPGTVVDDIEFLGNRAAVTVGITVEQAKLARNDEPIIVQNCSFANFGNGLQVMAKDGDATMPCNIIVLRDNSIRSCNIGLLINGEVSYLLIAGNRIWDCAVAAIAMHDIRPGSGQILIANNTLQGVHHCILLKHPIMNVTDVEIVNNLILSERPPDIAFDGPSEAIEQWRFHHNTRQVQVPSASDPSSREWVEPGGLDTVVPKVDIVSTDPANKGFLRPSPGSLLGSAATDGGLPDYVGTLPPEDVRSWDSGAAWERLRQGSSEESK